MQRTMVWMLLLFLSCTCVHAQRHREKQRKAGEESNTTFMKVFAKLERDWATAIQKHDQAALDALLAPEFVYRNGDHAEHVTARSEWLQNDLPNYTVTKYNQALMAVRVFPGDVAVVSFVQSQEGAAGDSKEDGRFLVVHVWVANRERRQWQLAQSYWAPIRPTGSMHGVKR